ncbi:MAG: hypothetical protein ABMA00_08225, partial [Gemmatimonas sp.]
GLIGAAMEDSVEVFTVVLAKAAYCTEKWSSSAKLPTGNRKSAVDKCVIRKLLRATRQLCGNTI